MRKFSYLPLFAALLIMCSSSPGTAGAVVIGDSLGVGVAMVSGLKGLARLSVHIRGSRAIEQINSVPPGSTAFLVLGTNDAVGSVRGIEKSIDNIVRAADKRNIKLVWIGPPCVRKVWDRNSRELDGVLRARLASTSVRYVGMRDEGMCSGNVHAGDGVHLTMRGYGNMWDKARAAAGFAPPARPANKSTSSADPMKEAIGAAAPPLGPAVSKPAGISSGQKKQSERPSRHSSHAATLGSFRSAGYRLLSERSTTSIK